MSVPAKWIPFLALLMAVYLLHPLTADAQQGKIIKIEPTGGKVDAKTRKNAYLYPEFKKGKASLLSGISTTSMFNYNLLSGEVEFIDDKKDTLAIENIAMVESITMGEDLYFYHARAKAMLKFIDSYEATSLLKEERYQLINVKNKGAFGMESNTLPPSNSAVFHEQGTFGELATTASLLFKVKTYFYVADARNHFVMLKKSSLYRLFPSHKAELQAYMESKKVDFNDEASIKGLLQYCATLGPKK